MPPLTISLPSLSLALSVVPAARAPVLSPVLPSYCPYSLLPHLLPREPQAFPSPQPTTLTTPTAGLTPSSAPAQALTQLVPTLSLQLCFHWNPARGPSSPNRTEGLCHSFIMHLVSPCSCQHHARLMPDTSGSAARPHVLSFSLSL